MVYRAVFKKWYITIPMMKPQMMFATIMAIVHTIKTGGIGVQLSVRTRPRIMRVNY